jgi:hypothetical protein
MVMESWVCYASSHSHIILIDAGRIAVVILVQALSALFSRFHGINFRSGCLTKKLWMSYMPGMNNILSPCLRPSDDKYSGLIYQAAHYLCTVPSSCMAKESLSLCTPEIQGLHPLKQLKLLTELTSAPPRKRLQKTSLPSWKLFSFLFIISRGYN